MLDNIKKKIMSMFKIRENCEKFEGSITVATMSGHSEISRGNHGYAMRGSWLVDLSDELFSKVHYTKLPKKGKKKNFHAKKKVN